MGIGISNVSRNSADYIQYLKDQLEQITDSKERKDLEKEMGLVRHQEYNLMGLSNDEIKEKETEHNSQRLQELKAIKAENLQRFTRCSGALADEYGLTGALDDDKLTSIAELQMGIDPRTAPFVQPKTHYNKTIIDPYSYHITDSNTGSHTYLNKDDMKNGYVMRDREKIEFKAQEIKHYDISLTKREIENGWVKNSTGQLVHFKESDITVTSEIKRKNATEMVYTMDSSFSYLYQLMPENDKKEFEKLFFDSVAYTRETVFEPIIKDSTGKSGKIISSSFMHLGNREGEPFVHIHDDISNLLKLEDGTIRAMEMDAIKDPNFHKKADAIFTAKLIENMQEKLPQYKMEAYDKNNQKIVIDSVTQEVKNWRVAFDDESLAKIKEKSKARVDIENILERETKDENSRYSKQKSDLEKSFTSGDFDKFAYKKKISALDQSHKNKLKHINSTKHKNQVHGMIKNKKKDESLDKQSERLSQSVSDMSLKFKADADVGPMMIISQKDTYSDQNCIDKLLTTEIYFNENQLTTEFVKKYGSSGKERAEQYIKNLKEDKKSDIIVAGKSEKGTKKEIFTSKSLIRQELQNVEIMQTLMDKQNKTALNDKKIKNGIAQAQQEISNEINSKIGDPSKHINFKLNEGQTELVKATFNNSRANICIGVPGSGKSTALKVISKIAKEEGFTTYGLGPTNKVASALKDDTSIDENRTIHSFNSKLEDGAIKLDNKSIVFIDESSMVGVRQFNQLLKHVDKAGAKIVMIGDHNQLSSVEIGSTMHECLKNSDIQKHQENIVVLDEINRQKNEVALSIAESTSLAKIYKTGNIDEVKKTGAHIEKAFDIMEKNDQIKYFDTTEEKISALATDYVSDMNKPADKLVLACENKSVDAVNSEIQQKRFEKGELSQESLSNGKQDFHVGDRVIMTAKSEFKKQDKDAHKVVWDNFKKTKEAKELFSEFKKGKIDEKDFKEQQKSKLSEYKKTNGAKDDQFSNGDFGTIKNIRNGKAEISFDNGKVNE
ncbi:MAG: hypothetical protein C4323_23540, partial [Mastigocladus sp. ERB_26_2]